MNLSGGINILKPSWAIRRVSVQLRTNVSEISLLTDPNDGEGANL